MKAKVRSVTAIICLITLLFFCILSCDNGSSSGSAASDDLVKVSLTVDEANSSQNSISIASGIDPSNFTYYYKAEPKWSQSLPIHGSTGNNFVLIPSYNAGMGLGYFTAGPWTFTIQVKNGATVIYQGSSDVTISSSNFSVNVIVNKIIAQASGSVSVSVTAPTVTSEAMTVAWTGTENDSDNATATPQGDGTTEFTFLKSDLSSGTYVFTLSHSAAGSGAAVAVDLRPGERVEITGSLENGVWQVGAITVKVYEVTINSTGCTVPSNISSAAAGDRVSFYISPYAGNTLDSITVTWSGGTIIPSVSAGLYSFIMPDGDVTVAAVCSGIDSDILVTHFKSIIKILYNSYPSATSFGRSLSEPSADIDEYFETKNVKIWYDPDASKICWYSGNQDHTMKFQSGSLANLFKDCSNFTSITMVGMDTSEITDMSGMFQNCTALTSLDLGNIDTGNVENMSYMFCGCRALTGIDFGSNFNTANVTDMSCMFSSLAETQENPPAMNLTSLDVSGFDTSKVTSMKQMFYMCYKLTALDVSGFRTPLVTDMSHMFACYNYGSSPYPGKLTTLNLSDWDFTNVTRTVSMFDRQEKLDSGLTFPAETNFKSLTTMDHIFSQCLSLTPATFRTIVATWKFSEHDDYENTIYGNSNTSMFGNAQDTVPGLNNSANYIFRENTQTKSGGKFAIRDYYETADVDGSGNNIRLYIGGGSNKKYARLTTVETP